MTITSFTFHEQHNNNSMYLISLFRNHVFSPPPSRVGEPISKCTGLAETVMPPLQYSTQSLCNYNSNWN